MIKKIYLNNYAFIKTDNTKNKINIKTEQVQQISKVEELKKAINQGSYKIDIHQTALAMAKALLK